jgi:hypothetical protein
MSKEPVKKPTVGSQYLEAQKYDSKGLTLGEINEGMVQSLISDLNECIASDPFEGRSFYINVVEERDLQMPNAIKRRLFVTKYRPYPEDNTLVFYIEPKEQKAYYCWDLPHHSEFPNILINQHLYDGNYVQRIKEWMSDDLCNFGFIKVSMSSSQVEGYDEKTINSYREAYYEFCKKRGDDPKAVETERKYGYFWIPNNLHKDKLLDESTTRIFLPVN